MLLNLTEKEIRLQKNILFILLCVFTLTGCGRDEIVTPPEVSNTSKGAYILSEGTFTPGTSKLSFYNISSDSFYVNIFNPVSLGNSPDGMILSGDILYITEQGNFGSAGKIYKTDTNGTVLLSANTGVNPYSLTEANNKLYITNGPANSVSVVDKNSLSTIKTISTGLYPQEIISIGNKVFVCNTSVFGGGTDSTITVIDAVADSAVATIVLKKFATSLSVSADNKLLIGCPGDASTAVIYKVEPSTYIKTDSFKNMNHGFCRDITVINSTSLLFIGGDIYSEGTIEWYSLLTSSSVTLIPKPANEINYSLAYDHESEKIYVGTASTNFTSAGRFQIYNSSGTLQKSFTISNSSSSGLAPRRIVVKN